MDLSTLTAKGQVTIPKGVREVDVECSSHGGVSDRRGLFAWSSGWANGMGQ